MWHVCRSVHRWACILVPLHELPVAGAAAVQAPAQTVGTPSLLHCRCGRGGDGFTAHRGSVGTAFCCVYGDVAGM
ncbi:hypothetical protein B0H14DRAFT_2705145 [Mycena olivaceomarginata]|nr:hypothetical protein B0H14DRAFT_2705145 [Mycena olivaceomarginata]